MLFAQFQNLLQLANPSAVADKHHSPGFFVDFLLHIHRVQAQVFIYVGKAGAKIFVENGVVGGDEGNGGGDDFVPVLPAVFPLEDIHSQMESGSIGVEIAGVGVSGIGLPGVFQFHGFAAGAGPALLQALADLVQALLYMKFGFQYLNGRHNAKSFRLILVSMGPF